MNSKKDWVKSLIENNPELNQYQKGIDFLASVKTGKTKISYEY